MSEPPWLPDAMKKYKRKLNHVRLRGVFTREIDMIQSKCAVAQLQNRHIIDKVKPILQKEGILPDMTIAYYCYSLALDKSQRTLEFMVDRIREHQILRDRWESRGLDPSILDKLDTMLIWNKTTP